MGITGVFYKILGKEFAVMRASVYDDYANGVDNVLVNIETGDVICAFDELYDDIEGERAAKKIEKIKNKAKKGGTEIKYGITFERDEKTEGNKLVKKPIKNVPTFCLALSNSELDGLLSEMGYDIAEPPTEVELKVFNKLVTSLNEQTQTLQEEEIPEVIANNLNKFTDSLERMKEIRAGF